MAKTMPRNWAGSLLHWNTHTHTHTHTVSIWSKMRPRAPIQNQHTREWSSSALKTSDKGLCPLYLLACQVSYHGRLQSYLLCLCDVFRALLTPCVSILVQTMSVGCEFCESINRLVFADCSRFLTQDGGARLKSAGQRKTACYSCVWS